MKIPAFEHVIFDGAMQVECMSSEESDADDDPNDPTRQFQTRGLPWRSSRLVRFYQSLDNEDARDKSNQPKRGSGKVLRSAGPPKAEFQLPPEGISSWMISKRWLAESVHGHPELPDLLEELVDNSPSFDWSRFHLLGEASDTEQSLPMAQHHHPYSSSSLHYALA
jgi:hypothetical protein